jgi:hypothetical protein
MIFIFDIHVHICIVLVGVVEYKDVCRASVAYNEQRDHRK